MTRAQAPPRKRRGPTPIGQRESLARRTARRSGSVIRFSRRHGGSLASWTGFAGLGVCAGMWAFTGTVYVLTGAVCATAAVGGAAVAHHQRNKVINGPNSRRPNAEFPTWREKDRAEDAMREGKQPEWAPENRTVTVTSHSRDGSGVRSHTRAAPNQGKHAPPAPFPTGSGRFPGRSDGSRSRDEHGNYVPPKRWSNPKGTDTHDSEGNPYGEQVRGFPGWVRGETHPDGRAMTEHEKRNHRAYEAWKANPNAAGDYWDHQRGRAITADEMEADRKGRWSWQHRHSVFQDERTGQWSDAWDRPVEDPEVRRDRSQPGDDPDSWA